MEEPDSNSNPFPIRLVVGIMMVGAAALTNATGDYPSMAEGERIGYAATCAVLGLLGVGLAVWGFLIWRRNSDS